MRLRGYADDVPKPMVQIGNRPILWHLMKFYAHFGHKDFILCLGYQGNVIKDYFLNYDAAVSNDFILSTLSEHHAPQKNVMTSGPRIKSSCDQTRCPHSSGSRKSGARSPGFKALLAILEFQRLSSKF